MVLHMAIGSHDTIQYKITCGMKVLLTVLLLGFTGCSRSFENKISGNWYYFSDDTTYFELYVNENNITSCNNRVIGTITYDYQIDQDSVYLFFRDEFVEKYHLVSGKRNSLTLVHNDIDTLNLQRVKESIDFYSIKQGERENYVKFIESFLHRSMKARLNE